MKAVSIAMVVNHLINNDFRFISGKYFYKNNEVKHADKYIYKSILQICNDIPKTQDVEEVKKQLQFLSEEEYWPELPIVTKAKELGPINEQVTLAFPLTKKQLLIINRLLYHTLDQTMFITTGIGGSGKSTFLNIIKQLFDNDFAAIPLSELNGFMVAEAVSKRLICSDELGKGELDTKILKTIISRQDLKVNPKYGRPFDSKCQCALFYCCNKAPRVDCTDTGILRRVVFYERNTKIQNPNLSLYNKIYTEEELLQIARRALAYEDDNWFDKFKADTHKYLMKDNSVYLFLKDEDGSYSDYREFCQQKGLKAFSEPNFNEIKALFESWINE